MVNPLAVRILPLAGPTVLCDNSSCGSNATAGVKMGDDEIGMFCDKCSTAVFFGINKGIAGTQRAMQKELLEKLKKGEL